MFEKEFVQQLLGEAKPFLKELIEEVLAEKNGSGAICVSYDEAGRMIGTSYEGIRKMVRKGELRATKRGRRCGISVSELNDFVRRNTQ
ncbi:MAG: helix-turn-helix domain-containing protein [Bryobacteraceae bacterium]|jgi:excisionase family DNA binding protein